jgi:16S rRNA C967 or C1407 C5-methylase (RsmB/RsmF family)
MIFEILSGWKNYLSKSDVAETVAHQRAIICSACPHVKQGKLLAFIKDSLTEIEGAYCNICKCPLSAKVRSIDICPQNKW